MKPIDILPEDTCSPEVDESLFWQDAYDPLGTAQAVVESWLAWIEGWLEADESQVGPA